MVIGALGTDTTYGGNITQGAGGATSLAVTKAGSGILTLSGINNYTGETKVTGGTLILGTTATAGAISTSSTLNVGVSGIFSDGSTTAGRDLTFAGLKGAGTINSALTTNKIIVTGKLAPGDDGIGTLNIGTGGLQVNNGAHYQYEIGASTSDSTTLAGPLTFAGTQILDLSTIGAVDPTGRTFILFDSTSAIGSVGSWTVNRPAGWSGGTVAINPVDNTQLVLTGIIPEPATLGLVGAFSMLTLSRRRRK